MAIEQLAEEVANNLEEAAEVTRKLNTAGLSYFAFGLGVGAVVGFYFGYKMNREKIRAEAYKDAEVEVAQLREIYLQKTLASINTEKPPVEEVVEKLGYSVKVPERPLPAPVPILDDLPTGRERLLRDLEELPENPVGTSKSMNAGWNYEEERKNRTPEFPYVIHQNEYNHSNPNYSKLIFTYWAIDGIITDEDDESPVINGDVIVGLENLKFGHGADDSDVVYVRNDVLEMDMQICRVNRNYHEEALNMQIIRDDDDDDDS